VTPPGILEILKIKGKNAGLVRDLTIICKKLNCHEALKEGIVDFVEKEDKMIERALKLAETL
jgi:hypothetical protein